MAGLAILMVSGYISLIFVCIHIMNSDAPMSIRVHQMVVTLTWAIGVSWIIATLIESDE